MAVRGAALAGLGVLVTRPAHQAERLCQLIEAQGGAAYRFPVLQILGPLDSQPLQLTARRLEDYDWAIFISANAVDRALETILAVRTWPASTRIAVIGRSSAQALEEHGLNADLVPNDRFDSEALLSLPALQRVEGQRFVIFRGDGGRELLADTLRQRGARVDYVEAYRRVLPAADTGPLLAQWRDGAIDIVVVNSSESLANLFDLLGESGAGLLRQTPLLVVSERMLPLVQQLGFKRPPVVAENATDVAVMQALVTWRAARRG
jgi:uroporphyrinogen-III synthase